MPRSNRKSLKEMVCTKCKILKPILDFYTYKRKFCNKNIVHITSWCKECNTYYKKNNFTTRFKFVEYKRNAKRRNLEFSLDMGYFEWLRYQPCNYCGQIAVENKPMGVDRVINSIGYIKENCVPCCKKCNQIKWTMTEKEYIEHCKKVTDFNSTKVTLSLIKRD